MALRRPGDESRTLDDTGPGAPGSPSVTTATEVSDAFAPTAISSRHTLDGDLSDPDTPIAGQTVSLFFDPRDATVPSSPAAPAAGIHTMEDSAAAPFAPFSPPPPEARPWGRILGLLSISVAILIAAVAAVLLFLRDPAPGPEVPSPAELAQHLDLPPIAPAPPAHPAEAEAEPEPAASQLAGHEAPVRMERPRLERRGTKPARAPERERDEVVVERAEPAAAPEATPAPASEKLAPIGEERQGPGHVDIVVRRGGKPLPARIFVDGVATAHAPARLELPSGEHVIEVRTRDDASRKRPVSVVAGQATRVLFDL